MTDNIITRARAATEMHDEPQEDVLRAYAARLEAALARIDAVLATLPTSRRVMSQCLTERDCIEHNARYELAQAVRAALKGE